LNGLFFSFCFADDIEQATTEVSHESMSPTLVNGYPEAGSYVRPIVYNVEKEQFDELVGRAHECEQYIKYECYQSKLLSSAGTTPNNVARLSISTLCFLALQAAQTQSTSLPGAGGLDAPISS
jgi:hypothetical protein